MELWVSRFVCAAAVVLVLAQPVQASKEIDASVVFSEHCEMMLEQGTLDGRAEMTKALHETRMGDRDAEERAKWCLMAMLKYRRIDEFRLAWGAAGQLREGLQMQILFLLGILALIHTDGQCSRCSAQYDDDMVTEAAAVLLEDYDPAPELEHAAERAGFSEPRPSTVPSTAQEALLSFNYNALTRKCCGTKKNSVKLADLLLARGVRFTFLDEDTRHIESTNLSAFMYLDDEALMERLFASGASIERGKWKYLVGRAPTMAMVRLLERHGYVLSRKEYKEVAAGIRNNSKVFIGFSPREPEVFVYFQNKAK